MTQCPLAFHTCRFEEEVDLYQAATTDLGFTSCALPSLNGDDLNSSGSLELTEMHLRQISFDGASFPGVLGLTPMQNSKTADGFAFSVVLDEYGAGCLELTKA